MVREELFEVAYKVLHPFVGLVSWKKRGVVSAFQHSLNTAAIAGDIAKLLTGTSDDIVDVATYCGLFHDVYQKAKSTDESLTREKFEKVISHALEDIGLEDNIVKRVLEGCNYNVAENPGIWAGGYRVAAASVRLADLITSAEDAFDIIRKVHEEAANEKFKEIYNRLKLEIVSISTPQVALRSLLYRMAIRRIQEQLREIGPNGDNALFILTRNGLVILARKEISITWPVEIDYGDLKSEIGAASNEIRDILGRKSKGDPDRWARINRFAVDLEGTIRLDRSVEPFFVGVRLTGVEYGEKEGDCVICGLPLADPARPTMYGYFIYNEAATERWSPRYPGGVNLNELLQGWERKRLYICPFCVLDALTKRRALGAEQDRCDYVVQFFFTRPAHYEVAQELSTLTHTIVTMEGRRLVDVSSLVRESWNAMKEVKGRETGRERLILLDFTWALHLVLIEGERKELEDFAERLRNLSKAIILTGIYPVKFSHIPDPAVERRLIMPVHPLYDYDVNDIKHGRRVPLTLFALALLDELDGGRERRDRIRTALRYLDYPFWLAEDLLMKHRVGLEVLRAYDEYIRDPYSFIFKN